MGYSASNKLRPLNIKFDIYSDSEDNEFKSELVFLMKGSVHELREAATNAFQSRSAEVFKKASHKAKSTLILLDDAEFYDVVEEIKQHLVDFEGGAVESLNISKLGRLNALCDHIIQSLEREAEHLRSA
jgi:hypothetical protein